MGTLVGILNESLKTLSTLLNTFWAQNKLVDYFGQKILISHPGLSRQFRIKNATIPRYCQYG